MTIENKDTTASVAPVEREGALGMGGPAAKPQRPSDGFQLLPDVSISKFSHWLVYPQVF